MIRVKALETGEESVWKGERTGVWVDAYDLTPGEMETLFRTFPPHKLALEDILERGHWTRAEQYPQHGFITLRTPVEAHTSERLNILSFPHALVTVSLNGTQALELVWEMVGRPSVNTMAEVPYELLEHSADTIFKLGGEMERRVEELERNLFAPQKRTQVEEVLQLKRQISSARRMAVDGHAAVAYYARHHQENDADQVRYRDAQDNYLRAATRLEGVRDNLSSLLDLQLNLQNSRMNEVMRTLTAVSVIFLPLTFLAGVWGMNFEHMPELPWRYGYLFAWCSFALVGGGLAYLFKRRGWW